MYDEVHLSVSGCNIRITCSIDWRKGEALLQSQDEFISSFIHVYYIMALPQDVAIEITLLRVKLLYYCIYNE